LGWGAWSPFLSPSPSSPPAMGGEFLGFVFFNVYFRVPNFPFPIFWNRCILQSKTNKHISLKVNRITLL
jgi:hypothetical protein